ncbi:hypothetical protein F183_A48800 [Bryobacterales bacterium F-183]|nr:hypothetical protein F183_A48800 [Bryobacterales bacterium F-183]
MRSIQLATRVLCASLGLASLVPAQTTSNILGTVTDPAGAAVPNAKVTARNTGTNASKEATTDNEGRFRLPLLSIGSYDVTVEAQGFSKYQQSGITLRLNQDADLPIQLQVGAVSDTVTVSSDATLVNTTNAEVGVNFDVKRITELPLAPNRNVLNLALSVAGVSQLSNGNSGFADGGVSFSVNGARTRSNNFMLDGGDMVSPSVGGATQQVNNPDTVAEFRLITNQFLAEYGRAAGSVVNIVTKSGSNQFHGTAYWFLNHNKVNALSNLDKRNGFTAAPARKENQFAGTFGGPIVRDRTFFFVSALRWTDRIFQSGTSIGSAPTEAGKTLLNQIAGTLPQVRALLQFVPGAQQPTGATAPVTLNGVTTQIPLGVLSGAAPNLLNVWQWSARVDHRFNDQQTMFVRYQADKREQVSGQAVPPGLTSVNPQDRHIAVASLNSTLRPNLINELRLSYNRQDSATFGSDPSGEAIPSLEVNQLGMTGFNAAATRTAAGFAVNFPQSGVFNNYQIVNNVIYIRGSHNMKFGIDFRRQEQASVFNPTLRGRLVYSTLQDLVNDTALTATINTPLPGVPTKQHYKYNDYFFFLQDEWRATKNLTLSYGIRYESPGNALQYLKDLNTRVVAQYNNNPGFVMDQPPGRDTNNWAPRFGFNYRIGKMRGPLGWLTGEDKSVLRGGYSRTYDLIFNNMALNVFSAFPFTLVANPPLQGAWTSIDNIRRGQIPAINNPLLITRTTADKTFRAPLAEQFALQVQRQLGQNWALTVGGVSTKGTALFQSLDGNPTVPGTNGTVRVDPNRGIIRQRANSASSIYHSMQVSLEKRLSRGVSMATHYTWSAFIDDASEVFNASTAGEVAVAQNSFNRRADRGRSTYDRPHRFVVNGVWELPFLREQKGAVGAVLGGWQVSGFLTFQSGSPFSPLAGVDPQRLLSGIDSLIGNSIRPNVNTDVDVSANSIEQLWQQTGGRPATLFSQVTAASPLGNAGRNILRADGIGNLDLSLNKKFRLPIEGHALNFRAEMYNATNTRNFGIPNALIGNANFGNQWLTDGGNRRIVMGLRYTF